MPVLDMAQQRAESLRQEVVRVVAALQSELHAKARDTADPAESIRWVQMSLDVTIAYSGLGTAIEAATDALMTGEPARSVWE